MNTDKDADKGKVRKEEENIKEWNMLQFGQRWGELQKHLYLMKTWMKINM